MIDGDATLQHHFFEVTITDSIFTIPSYTTQNDLSLIMAPFKICHLYSPPRYVIHEELNFCNRALFNTKLFFRSPDSDTAQWISKTLGENEVIENSEGISFGAHQMRDGVSLNEQRKIKPIIPYTEFMTLPDLTAYIKLPEDYPITKITFTYVDLPNKNLAFVPKAEKEIEPEIGGDFEFENNMDEIVNDG